MEPKPHPRTTKQALAEQKVIADREREARLATGRKAVAQQRGEVDVTPQGGRGAVVPAPNTAVAVPDTRTAHERYLDEIAPTSIVGRMIKFSREGQFVTADDGESISESAEFIALVDQLLTGWVKFNGFGEPPTR
jgi:hypothetical protein